jgi:hypothetical protein
LTALQLVINNVCSLDTENMSQGLELVRLLLEKGATPNVSDNRFDTPLHLACINGVEGFVEMLLKYGANIDMTNIHGQTPLYCSICTDILPNPIPQIVKLLLEYGATLNDTLLAIVFTNNYPIVAPLIFTSRALDVCCEAERDLGVLGSLSDQCGPAFAINRLASKLQFMLQDPEALVSKGAFIEYAFKAIYALYKHLPHEHKELIHCDQSIITQYALEHNVDLQTVCGESIGEDFLSFLGISPVVVASDGQDEVVVAGAVAE